MNTPMDTQEELEKNARFRAAALQPVVEKLGLCLDVLIQIREELKKHHKIIERCI
jgi:hypothetical protein